MAELSFARAVLFRHLRIETQEVAEVIVIDLGKFGKAKMHRPTGLELAALVAVLVFAAVVWLAR